MKYSVKKFVAFLLTLVMMINMVPVSGLANTENYSSRGQQFGSEPHDLTLALSLGSGISEQQPPKKGNTPLFLIVVNPANDYKIVAYYNWNSSSMFSGVDNNTVSSDFKLYVLESQDNSFIGKSIKNILGSPYQEITTAPAKFGDYSFYYKDSNTDSYGPTRTIYVKKASHTAHITWDSSVNIDGTYVVFRQPIANSEEKAYKYFAVENNKSDYTIDTSTELIKPNTGNQTQLFSSEISTEVCLLRLLNNQPISDYMFAKQSFGSNNNVVYINKASFPDSDSGNTVQISTDKNTTNIHVGAARYTARLDFYDPWDVPHTERVSFDQVTLSASDGTTNYTASVSSNGQITFAGVSDLPGNLTGWTFGSSSLGDYILDSATPTIDGNEYVFTARKPNTYGVNIEYYEGWTDIPSTEVEIPKSKTITAIDKQGVSYTGTIGTTGAVSFQETIPEIAEWQLEGNTIGDYLVTFDENNPSVDSERRAYIIRAYKPRIYSAALSFYSPDSTEPLDHVTLSRPYTIKAVAAKDGTEYIGTVDTNGTVRWTDGVDTVETLPKISTFKFYNEGREVTRFDHYRLNVVSYNDEDLVGTSGAYQIVAREAKLYPSEIKYTPVRTGELKAYYYLVASIDGNRIAYAAVPNTDGSLKFVPFGSATGILNLRMRLADADGAPSTDGIELPDDATFELIKSDQELNAAQIQNAEQSNPDIDGYILELDPEVMDENKLSFTASKIWTGNKIQIRTLDYDGEGMSPDPLFGSNYYLRIRVHSQETDGLLGWNLLPVSWEESDITTLSVNDFVQMDQSADSQQRIVFDPEKHYIEVSEGEYPARVVYLENPDWGLNWNRAKDANDDPPEGYKYITGGQVDNGNYEIRLKQARPLLYHVKLKFNTIDLSKIKLDGGLFVKVTIKHQTGNDTYGWVPLTDENLNNATNDGTYTYLDIPINEWVDGQGIVVSGEKYRGTEKGVVVELVGVPEATISQASPTSYSFPLFFQELIFMLNIQENPIISILFNKQLIKLLHSNLMVKVLVLQFT